MSTENILFKNLKIVDYELSTHTEHNIEKEILETKYYVKWICQLGQDIEQQITKEEYDELYKDLELKIQSINNIGMGR